MSARHLPIFASHAWVLKDRPLPLSDWSTQALSWTILCVNVASLIAGSNHSLKQNPFCEAPSPSVLKAFSSQDQFRSISNQTDI